MTYDPKIHHRRSIRLRGHDYAGGGAYFVTICIHGDQFLLGKIVENEMVLDNAGKIVEVAWRDLAARFPSVALDAHQVMPNHFHGIIVIPGPGLEPSLARATGAPLIQPHTVRPGRIRTMADPRVGPTIDVAPGLAPAHPPRGVALRRRIGLPAIVGAFKSLSMIAVNQALGRSGKHLWQEDYYEHIIRNVEELEKTRDYTIHNPARWRYDPENPDVGPGLAPA